MIKMLQSSLALRSGWFVWRVSSRPLQVPTHDIYIYISRRAGNKLARCPVGKQEPTRSRDPVCEINFNHRRVYSTPLGGS